MVIEVNEDFLENKRMEYENKILLDEVEKVCSKLISNIEKGVNYFVPLNIKEPAKNKDLIVDELKLNGYYIKGIEGKIIDKLLHVRIKL